VPSRSNPAPGNFRDSAVLLLDGVSEVPTTGTSADRVALMATAQRGRVAWRQLVAAGVSTSAIGRLVASGHLRPVHHGVYEAGHSAPVPGGEEAAALLAARPGAALSHITALLWWGIADVRRQPGLTPIHIMVPGAGAQGPAGVVVHRSTILTARDLRVHEGLPLTAPARSLLDFAADQPTRELERMLDTALVQRRVSLRQINDVLARAGRHAGRAPLTHLTADHNNTTFTRSEAEERFLALIRDAGLPSPLVNVRRHGFELDFLWPRRGARDIAAEIDGYEFHGGRAAFERDRRRDGILRAAGIDVLRFTWRRLTRESHAVVVELATALSSAPA
jgi:very-short-patch-repair endonuclease